jgi:uncharacterized protein (UPF0264 family)
MSAAGLLVSVRSVAEAEAAGRGGASLIDVKEPARGPLGRADAETVRAVVAWSAGRVPVSMAGGELAEGWSGPLPDGLAFVKWGLAGCAGRDWRAELRQRRRTVEDGPGCRVVAVAYADWRRAAAPPPPEVAALAAAERFAAFLIDTWGKDGTTLTDWQPAAALRELVEVLRPCGVGVAVAGSLDAAAVTELSGLRPDWFAVRGAACAGGRSGAVEEERVAALSRILGASRTDVDDTPGGGLIYSA